MRTCQPAKVTESTGIGGATEHDGGGAPEGGALAVPRLFPVGMRVGNSPGLAVPRLFPGLFPGCSPAVPRLFPGLFPGYF